MVARARRGLALFVVLGGLGLACQIVAGIERVDKVAGNGEGGPLAPDASVDAQGSDPCKHRAPPPPPASDPAPGEELPIFVMAMESVQLDPRKDGGAEGFDLDGYCTCDERPNVEAGPSCTSKQPPTCDGDGGVDNRAIKLFPEYIPNLDFNQVARVNERIEKGRQTVLIFVRGWNGKKNDLDVDFAAVQSEGIREQNCPNSVSDGEGFFTRGGCGNDKWTTPPNTFGPGSFPTNFNRGYVADGTFVVQLDKSSRVPFGDYGIEFGDSIFTGNVVPLDENLNPRPWEQPPKENEKRLFRIERGVLAGRLAVADLLGAIGSVILPGSLGGNGTTHFCQNVFFKQVLNDVCREVDIPKSGRFDRQPGYACDAVSTAVGFTAMPALVGEEYNAPPRPNECEPDDQNRPKQPSEFVDVYGCGVPDGG